MHSRADGRWSGIRAHVCALYLALLAGCGGTRAPAGDPLAEPLGPTDPFTPATAALIWPGAENAYLLSDSLRAATGSYAVTWRGTFAGESMPAGRFGRPRASSPVVVWVARGRSAVWRASIAPFPVDDDERTRLLASVEITVTPVNGAHGRAQLFATIAPDSSFPVPARDDAAPPVLGWQRTRAGAPPVLGPRTASGALLAVEASAAPAQPAHWRFVLAGSSRLAGQLARTARTPHAALAATAEDVWQRSLAGATRLHVGDAALEQAVDEALLVLAGCTERDGEGVRGIGNPFHYRDTWIRDAARQASALAQWGLGETARDVAAGLWAFQGSDGDLLSQPGQLDGTGQALWAQDEVLSRLPGAPVPDTLAQALARAWRWCEHERALVRQRAPAFAGLMPPADPRDNELAAGYLFGTDAWTLAGYGAAARLLARAGNAATADSIRRSASAYAAALSERVRRGGGHVPACWNGPARDWGNFAALVPTGALSLAEAQRAALPAALASTAGLATYGTPDTLHLYLGADLAIDALLMGRDATWRSSLDATLHAQTGTGGLPEMYSRSTRGFGANLPPHATSAAALLVLLRQALVFDALGDTLRLTLGTLPAWWRSGSRLEHAPTRWGNVDLGFRRERDRVSWTWSPVPVWVELTAPSDVVAPSLPEGVVMKDRRRILVPPGRDRLEVTCAPE